MNKNFMIKAVGVIFVIMWITQVPYLFPHPFQEHEGIKNLAKEATQFPDVIKQESVIEDRSAEELEKAMLAEIRINWIKATTSIIIGIISGCFFIARRKVGYSLAFFLSLIMIGLKVLHMVRHPSTFSLDYYSFMLERSPVLIIHDLSMQLVLLGTVAFLVYLFLTRQASQPCEE